MNTPKNPERDFQWFGAVGEAMEEGLSLIRLDDRKIVFANRQFEKMFGYQSGELVGKHASILNAGSTEKSKKEKAAEILVGLESFGEWRGENFNPKKDGTTLLCSTTVLLMEHPVFGQVAASIHNDISG